MLAAALGGAGGDERARAGPRLDHAGDLERGDRLAHRRAADLQPAREIALGRQPLARRQPAGADVGGEPVGHVLVALAGPDRSEIGLCDGQDWFALRTSSKVHAMALTFNSVDPRTGEPGPSFTEATPDDVHAAVAAAAAVHRSGALRDRAKRAALLRGAAARLRAVGDEIVAVCEAESGLPEARLRGELERTCGPARGVRRDRRRRRRRRGDHRPPRSGRRADPQARHAPHAGPARPGRGVRRVQFPARVLDRRRRHRVGARRRLPGDRQGPPVAPGYRRDRRPRGARRGRRRRPARRDVREPAGRRRRGRRGARRRAGDRRRRLHRLVRGGKAIFDRAARACGADPRLRRDGLDQPDRDHRRRRCAARADKIAEGLAASVSNFGGQLCTKPGVVFVPAGEAGDAFAADLAARLDGVPPSVLLNERLRDALQAAVDRLEARPEVRALAQRRARRRPRLPPPADRVRGARRRSSPTSCWRSTSARSSSLLRHGSRDELLAALDRIDGQLSGTLHAAAGRGHGGDRRRRSPRAPAASCSTASRPASPSPTACITAARIRRPRARRTRRSA